MTRDEQWRQRVRYKRRRLQARLSANRWMGNWSATGDLSDAMLYFVAAYGAPNEIITRTVAPADAWRDVYNRQFSSLARKEIE